MERPPAVPLHLTSLAILAPNNAPLYVHAFTGKQDEMRAYHLAHAAVDVIEERIVMTSSPGRPSDPYLGLLFCMEDMAFYGFQTPTKLRLVLSISLVDASIKDADIVATFRAVYQLLLRTIHNPFLSLPDGFHAVAAPAPRPSGGADEETGEDAGPAAVAEELERVSLTDVRNEPVADETMFASGPDDIRPEWLAESPRFQKGIEDLGRLLNGGRV